MKRRVISVCTFACCLAAACIAAEEPNESFEQATLLSPGALTTGPQSFSDGGLGITYADTMLGFYSNTTFSVLVRRNNDSTPIGDGRGSMIASHVVNRDGSIPLAISGFADLNFDGLDDTTGQPHTQSGNVELTLRVWDTGPTTVPFAEHVMDVAITPGEVSFFDFTDESWIGHTFTAIVDNTIDGGNDVDFWRFTGLTPGALYSARTTATTSPQGSIMRIYDAITGSVLADSIDAQENCPFGLCGTVSGTGDVVVALTGYDDFDFAGAHGALGNYTLNLIYDGDTDLDGDVDGDDLANMLLGFGTIGASREDGDVDLDGDVDRDDLAIWRLNAGAGSLQLASRMGPPMAGQSAGVPEPSALALLGVILPLACLTRSHRRRQRGSPESTQSAT